MGDREELEEVFSGFDKTNDGLVQEEDIKIVLQQLIGGAANPDIIHSIVQAIDKDGNGDISKDEFFEFYVNYIQPNIESGNLDKHAEFLFSKIDQEVDSSEGNGEISIGE